MGSDKPKLVNGTVTLSLTFSSDKSILDADRILKKTGVHVSMFIRENKVVLKGKNINTDQIVSDLKKAEISAQVVKIEEDPKPKPKHTVHLKVEKLCCEDNANTVKSKLKGIKGVEEVTVDLKLKKVTVKGTLESKEVVEAAAKVVAVKLWEEPNANKDKDKDKAKDKAKDKEVVTTASKNVHKVPPGQIFVYTTKDLYVNYR